MELKSFIFLYETSFRLCFSLSFNIVSGTLAILLLFLRQTYSVFRLDRFVAWTGKETGIQWLKENGLEKDPRFLCQLSASDFRISRSNA